ncbi:MAG: SpoIIE family protein phosphatase [Thermoleophilaceae bacterium]
MGSHTHTAGLRNERGTFLAALVAVCVVAAVDLAIQADAILVELLVVGPVIAAFGATPRDTAIVAAIAFLASIPLGLAGDAFGSAEHLIGVAAVGIVGALATGVARLRSTRELDAARLTVQYGVARVLAEAKSLEAAVPDLLEAIGAPLGWLTGNLWERRGGLLHLVGSWTASGVELPHFEEATRRLDPENELALPARVWKTGRQSWVADYSADPSYPRAEAAGRDGLRGGTAFPVRIGSECVAVIEFFARDLREPDPDLIALTDTIGTLIGEFIESLRSAEAVRLSEARKSAVFASSLDAVITIDHEGHVVEFNPAAEQTFGRRAEDAIGSELAKLIVPPALRDRHRAALRRCVETGESNLLGQRVELTGMRADGSVFPVELAIDRIAGSEPPTFTGTVRDITARRRAEQEREELLHLEQLARVDATQARDQLEAILRGVADAVTAQAPDGRLLFANDAAVELLGYESSEALLSAPIAEIMDRFDVLDEAGRPFPVEQLPGRRALANGEGGEVVVRFRVHSTGEERWSAVKATPILDRQGAVTMAINVIEDITDHKRAELAQRFLSESSAVLGSSLDTSQVLSHVASLAVPEVADWCAVDMIADGTIARVALAHQDPTMIEMAEELRRRYPPDPRAATGVPAVVRSGRSELYPEITDELLRSAIEDDEQYRLIKEIGMRSAMIVPMVARARSVGALSFVSGPSGRRFDGMDLELAEELARRCATAIDNARLFTERAYIARTLQQSLLPSELPDIPGIEAAARFRPTGEGNEVGGDFYDLFETGGRGWTVVMGDVCGKGPDAAAVTALARYTLRAAAMRERLPSRSLRLLNEALLRQREDRRFCTVAYAYLEAHEGGVRIGVASGGHPLPMLVRSNGTVELVGEPGTLLGVLPDPNLEDRSLALSPGDALVFYTDGVIEGRGAKVLLDEDGLRELLAGCAGAGADAIAARVEDAAVAAQDGSPRDDIAVLVLRVAS